MRVGSESDWHVANLLRGCQLEIWLLALAPYWQSLEYKLDSVSVLATPAVLMMDLCQTTTTNSACVLLVGLDDDPALLGRTMDFQSRSWGLRAQVAAFELPDALRFEAETAHLDSDAAEPARAPEGCRA